MVRAIQPPPRKRRKRRAIAEGDSGTLSRQRLAGLRVVALREVQQLKIEAVEHCGAMLPNFGTIVHELCAERARQAR